MQRIAKTFAWLALLLVPGMASATTTPLGENSPLAFSWLDAVQQQGDANANAVTLLASSQAWRSTMAESLVAPSKSFVDQMSPSEAARYREYWGGKHDLSGGQPFGMKSTVTKNGELKTVTTYDQYGRPHRQYGLQEGESPHEHGFTYPTTPQPGTGWTPIRGPQRPIGSNE